MHEFDKYLSAEKVEEIKNLNKKANHIKNAEPIKITGYVAFLDVLGWKGIWKDDSKALNKINALLLELKAGAKMLIEAQIQKNCLNPTFINNNYEKDENYVNIIGAADTIVLTVRDYFNQGLSFMHTIVTLLINNAAKEGIYLRGAISYGDFYRVDGADFYMGEAIDEASIWSESCNWIGVILTPEASKRANVQNLLFTTISKQKQKQFIEYENLPIKDGYQKKGILVLNYFMNRNMFKIESYIKQGYDKVIRDRKGTYVVDKYTNTIKFLQYIEKNGFII